MMMNMMMMMMMMKQFYCGTRITLQPVREIHGDRPYCVG
jgi:hypothetical protein